MCIHIHIISWITLNRRRPNSQWSNQVCCLSHTINTLAADERFGIDIISLKIETKKLIMISQQWSRWWLGTVGCQVNFLAFEEYISHIQYWHSCIFNQIVYVIYVYRVMSWFSWHINDTCTIEPIYITVRYRGYWVYRTTDECILYKDQIWTVQRPPIPRLTNSKGQLWSVFDEYFEKKNDYVINWFYCIVN